MHIIILATVHFLYPKLGSFSDMEYYFYQLAYYRDSKVPKRFVGQTHDFKFYSKEEGSPFEPLLTGDTPFKTSPQCFSHFHGLVPDTNYKHLECSVMLGTHSEPRRGEMSHIYNIYM